MKTRPTILVVDDEPDVVMTVQELLRREYRVLGATSGEEGVSVLRREEVDVVVSDHRMPGMTGVELLRRARSERPDTTRILVTGYAELRDVIDAINRAKVFHYLAKPWDPDVFEAVIRDAAERHHELAAGRRCLAELERVSAELRARGDDGGRFFRAAERLEGAPEAPGAPPQDARPVELAPLLREAADALRPFAGALGGDLSVDLGDALGAVTGDPALLRDGVDLLLVHAIRRVRAGGRVELSARREAGGAVVRVGVSEGAAARGVPEALASFFAPGGARVTAEAAPGGGEVLALALPA